MSLVCSSVGISQKPFIVSKEQELELLSLTEYHTIAQKIICKYANRITPGLKGQMLASEEAISHVVEYIIKGDIGWKAEKNIPREVIRSKWGVFAIRRYLLNLIQEQKKGELQTDFQPSIRENKNGNNGSTQWEDKMQKTPLQELIDKEEKTMNPGMVKLMELANLTEIQRGCLICKFYGGLTVEEISKECGVQRTYIQQIIEKALLRLKKWSIKSQ